jgi:hypothetical protein
MDPAVVCVEVWLLVLFGVSLVWAIGVTALLFVILWGGR